MLPSDIARLVLMYLKDEGMTRSYKQFFNESPHLEELRRHPDVEPSVPYEKGLPEILNEYAKIMSSIKERLNCNQLVNSLWKMHNEVIGQLKFQYTGNAGLLQTYEPTSIDRRALSRYRLTGLRKQQELQHMLASKRNATTPPSIPRAVIDTSHSTMNSVSMVNSVSVATSPIDMQNGSNHLPRSSHVKPGGTRTSFPEMEVEMHASNGDEPHKGGIQDFQHGQEPVVIPELRTPSKNPSCSGTQLETPIGKSPKRKSAAPRRIQGTVATSISPHSDATSANQWEEDGRDLPEVLESLIKNIDFQEKLAQNINKARPVDSLGKDDQAEQTKEADSAHTLGNQSSTSIEELLNLQMSDETIHDIVQKTSLDPAFESLFSLFINQNSEDGSSHQLEHLTNETPGSSHDIVTDQSPLPATSHCLSEQEASQVTQTSTNRNAREKVPLCEPAASRSYVITNSANTGHLNGKGAQPDATSSPATSSPAILNLQVSIPNLTTSTTTAQIPPNQSPDQVVTLPVILNQSGPYHILQQTNTTNAENIILNGPADPPGGTIFMSPDGRILATSNVVLQSGQPLQTSGTVQNVSIRQADTQVAVSGVMQNATPNIPHVCPVHGIRTDHIGMSGLHVQQSTGMATNLAVASATPSTVNTTISTQNASGEDQNEVRQLLGNMVESDVGSLFIGSPENSHSKSPASSKRTPKKVGAKKRRSRSPKTPSLNSNPGSQTLNSNNQSNNHEAMQNNIQGQSNHSTVRAVTTQPNQVVDETRNIFAAISNNGQVLATSPEIGMQTISPPSNTVKQRKHIQFKEIVMSRTLDVGGSCEALPKPRQRSPANSSTKISETRRLSTSVLQLSPSNPALHQKATTTTTLSAQHREIVNSFQPVNQLAQLTSSTPEKVLQVHGDMSAEVNIAAQMLVCLSNSPPSLRKSPYRMQRQRRRSGCSPGKSPTQDHIVQLRKEIGLTPKRNRLQQKDLTNTPSAPAETSLGRHQYGDSPTNINEHTNDSRTQATSSQEQTQSKDKNSSKRKSRTPRKQTNTMTETVVLTMPSESNQKPKNSTPTVHTRAFSQKSKSPGKLQDDTIPTRKSPRKSRSPGRPTLGSLVSKDLANNVDDRGKKEGRGQKRRREKHDKEEKTKKPKTAKNPKKGKKSQGFPSNLDVDKFLSSLQYAE